VASWQSHVFGQPHRDRCSIYCLDRMAPEVVSSATQAYVYQPTVTLFQPYSSYTPICLSVHFLLGLTPHQTTDTSTTMARTQTVLQHLRCRRNAGVEAQASGACDGWSSFSEPEGAAAAIPNNAAATTVSFAALGKALGGVAGFGLLSHARIHITTRKTVPL
jgi:hypothetical protein